MFQFDWAKRTHKGLRKWVLYLVRDSPKSGVEIMDIMEANLQGWWRPSPGSIYPLLEKMKEEGVLAKGQDRKFSLTPLGREELDHPFPFRRTAPAAGPRSVDEILADLSSYVTYLEDVAQAKDGRLSGSAQELRELGERLAKVGDSA